MGAMVLTGGRKPRKSTDLRSGEAQTWHFSTTTLRRVPAASGRGLVKSSADGALVMLIDRLLTWPACCPAGRLGSRLPSFTGGLNTMARFGPGPPPERPLG